MIMAGKADIPATRLLGRSPQGMNATGESDLRNYYDRIRSGQQTDLAPTLRPLDMALLASTLGTVPPEAYVEWNPLYQMSEKEAADVEKVFADTAEKYANMGVIPDTALTAMVRGGIIERGQWPGADNAYADADAAGEMPDMLDEPDPEPMVEPVTVTPPAPVTYATPRTLYVRRDVVNAAAIKAWAAKQGFAATVDDQDGVCRPWHQRGTEQLPEQQTARALVRPDEPALLRQRAVAQGAAAGAGGVMRDYE